MSNHSAKEDDTMAKKRMREKSIQELEEEFLAYGIKKEWHSLEASAFYLALRYMANEQYEEALEAVVSAMAIQISGCNEADCVYKYDNVTVSTYRIGMIRECGEMLALSQEELEKKVKEALASVFGLLPFSYYEPETALAILKDCRNKSFDPGNYSCDYASPNGDKRVKSADEKETGRFAAIKACPCI